MPASIQENKSKHPRLKYKHFIWTRQNSVHIFSM